MEVFGKAMTAGHELIRVRQRLWNARSQAGVWTTSIVRRECLDWLIPMHEAYLRRVLPVGSRSVAREAIFMILTTDADFTRFATVLHSDHVS